MKLGTIVVVFSGVLLVACGGATHDDVVRLTERVTELEKKVDALGQPKLLAVSPEGETSYDPAEPGWSMSGGGRDVYEVHLDRAATREGHPTGRLAPVAKTHDKYGTWARSLDATPYLGKRVRFTMYTKTAGTSDRADFWARAQAPDSPGDGPGLGGHWTFLPENSDWERREIVLDVDRNTAYFNYGVGIAGPGTLWFDAPSIEVVGADVPVTPTFEGEQTVAEWTKTGIGAKDFKIEADDKDVRIERTANTSERYVAVMHVVPAAAFTGKTAKAELDVRTEGLEGEAACVMKVQTSRDLAYSGFLSSDIQPVSSTTKGFTHCTLGAKVPTEAKWILYGFTYRGGGKAWVRGGTLK